MPKSETRQRNNRVTIRLTDDERRLLEECAESSGLSIGAFIRMQAIGKAGERHKRRPPADRQELTRLLAQLGKVGGNINQIAKRVNSKDWPPNVAIEKAAEAVTAAMTAIRKAILK